MMGLIDLWKSDRTQITEKRIDQLIAFAGDGKLLDGSATSTDLRELLATVPSDLLGKWIDECLTNKFQDFGLLLQDLVNEIGRRLNFELYPGVYRGHGGKGYDGIWRIPGSVALLVESKSSTTYRINLGRIAEYREQVPTDLGIPPEGLSILLVIGRDDTEDLEAQVRGSRYAWNVRLIGIDSLFRLLKLKEALDDPSVERQIQEILLPQEFTRLDRIVDLVFATAEDVQSDVEEQADDDKEDSEPATRKRPARFHAKVLPRLEKHFGHALVKRSRVLWSSPDANMLVSCQVSKEFTDQRAMDYWFGLKRTTKEALEGQANSYCSFALGGPERVVLIPYHELANHLDGLFTSPEKDGRVRHWHVRFVRTADGIDLMTDRDQGRRNVSEFFLKE